MTKCTDTKKLDIRSPQQTRPLPDRRLSWRPETIRPYRPPRLIFHGQLGALIRGASFKGTDSVGELDPNESYPS